jgi:putative Mn2+ efflux pump MntP
MLGATARPPVARTAAQQRPPGKTNDASPPVGRRRTASFVPAPKECDIPGFLTLTGLGLSLSVDAFAAAVCKGSQARHHRFLDALRIGAVFGFFEAIAPALGWAIGLALSTWIAAVDHWVAFFLLGGVGCNMLWQASRPELMDGACEPETEPSGNGRGLAGLIVAALATSIDATAVGVSLAFLQVNILTACLVIGGVTTVVATIGVLIGKRVGVYLGRYAEMLGGIALICIGSVILYEHLHA